MTSVNKPSSIATEVRARLPIVTEAIRVSRYIVIGARARSNKRASFKRISTLRIRAIKISSRHPIRNKTRRERLKQKGEGVGRDARGDYMTSILFRSSMIWATCYWRSVISSRTPRMNSCFRNRWTTTFPDQVARLRPPLIVKGVGRKTRGTITKNTSRRKAVIPPWIAITNLTIRWSGRWICKSTRRGVRLSFSPQTR